MKMKRSMYWVLIFAMMILVFSSYKILLDFYPPETAKQIQTGGVLFWIFLWMPVLFIIRARTAGLTWKEVTIAFIPFYGFKYLAKAIYL